MRIEYAKGHGAHNDFVIVPALDGTPDLAPDEVRLLCDRRAGVGADGVLRVTYGRQIADWQGDPDLLFMDYRNADGSPAATCGNGLRVFAHYVLEHGLAVGPEVTIGTRAGLYTAWKLADGRYKVNIGKITVANSDTWTGLDERRFKAIAVNVGNPHAVALLRPTDSVAALDLSEEPDYDRAVFPQGVNCEFARALAPGLFEMRVYERGVGETLACGTGAVATAVAYAHSAGLIGQELKLAFNMLGGRLDIELNADSQAYLIGPAVINAHGVFEGTE
ncbi:MAG: diaminopimelate epimerase [Propionibacteriaceae bacterium]|jgi:diaminopimelate epimerase|nr:diaminopimelate epimerase [Propionibacteriaceae bacterium]